MVKLRIIPCLDVRGVGGGEGGRVPGVPQALEANALDDAAIANVEAGDDAESGHQATSAAVERPRVTPAMSSHRRSSAAPQAPESSGCSWQASTAPRSTAATKELPCSDVAPRQPSGTVSKR